MSVIGWDSIKDLIDKSDKESKDFLANIISLDRKIILPKLNTIRMITYILKENIDEHKVIFLKGLRKVGKTTTLLQLKEYYKDKSLYVDMSKIDFFVDIVRYCMNNNIKYLLLDEVSKVEYSENLCTDIRNLHNHVNIITTGSCSQKVKDMFNSCGRGIILNLDIQIYYEHLMFKKYNNSKMNLNDNPYVLPNNFQDIDNIERALWSTEDNLDKTLNAQIN